MKEYLLGLDIGTSDIKAVLFDLNGKEINIARRKNELLLSSNGMYEQDMNVLWGNVCIVIKNIIEIDNEVSKNIIGIGLSAQGEGCWLLDNNGEPVRSAILWNDIRSTSIIENLSEEFIKRHKNITGSVPCMGGMNFILKWLSIYDSENLDKARYAVFCKDWIKYKLTGVISTEITDMSTSMLDLKTKKPSLEMFELLDIQKYSHLTAPLIDSNSAAGFISKETSKITGLKEGIPVASGYIDVVSSCIGSGAIEENEVCSIIGTSCINEYVSSSFNTFQGSASYLCHGDNNHYICLIGTMAGTPNIDWISNGLFSDVHNILGMSRDFYEYIDKKISDIPVGAGGVIYHPYIRTSGERAPFLDVNARAGFFGVDENTTRWHLFRALYEGIAFSIKDCFQNYKPKRIFLSGGGSNSILLDQIVADCMNAPVLISKSKEIAARGAAISAGIASKAFSSLKEAVKSFQTDSIILEPNNSLKNFYDEYFDIYKELRIFYSGTWKKRKEILEKFKL